MSLFKEAWERILANQEKQCNSISWGSKLPRFSNYMSGIIRGRYYAITGAPGAAKTQFTDNLFLYHTIEFAKSNNLDVEIVYFSFEISKHEKIINGISKRLFEQFGVKIPPRVLLKEGDAAKLDEIQLSKLGKVRTYFEDFENYVTFYDDRLTPSQIYEIQMKKIKENGNYDHATGSYTPHNPDKYLIFITDHISLIPPDTGQTLHSALATFSANNIYLKNKFGVTIVNIHQQGVDGQVQQFTTKGDSVASKVEPKLASLGDNRTLGRDYDMVLGLLSPMAYEMDYYKGYRTKRLKDHCRFLSIIKNRHGEQGMNVGLYFDGAVGYFEELPKPEDFLVIKNGQKVDNDELYERFIKGQVGILDPNKQRSFTFNS